ncbi:hypothetical protein V1520DRAFT_394395 [Lipomyces starkeyi]
MNALSIVFPPAVNQLCRWHIEQNILKDCRKHFNNVADFDSFMGAIMAIVSSVDRESQAKSLEELKSDFPAAAAGYFLSQWWENGHTTSRVEGSHGALKRAGKTVNRRATDRTQELSVLGFNEALFVRLEIRTKIETSKLCTAISRSALYLIYTEVMKKVRQQEKESSWETCDCSAWNRYLLPCSHRIQLGVPISITDVHPRWWVNPKFPPVNVFFQHIDAEVLLHLKDPAAALPRKGRPKGTRRLQTSAEVVQKMTDRVEKVRRCGSCKKTGHDRRNSGKCHGRGELSNDESIDGHDNDYRDKKFEEMWSDVSSLFVDGK